MSRFIESIKLENGIPFLLDYHQNRVNRTLKAHKSSNHINLAGIIERLDLEEKGLFKFRIAYDLDGNFAFQAIPYAVAEVQSFSILEDISANYSFKFEDRNLFELLKSQSYTQEIIITKNHLVTDTSISNLLFLKENVWYTPNAPLLNGVQRQYLLDQNKILETEISVNDLNDYSHFQIINSMNGFNESFIYNIDRIVNLKSITNKEDYDLL